MFSKNKCSLTVFVVLLCCSCTRKELTDMTKPGGNRLATLPKFIPPVVKVDVLNPKKNAGVLLTPEYVLNHRKLNGSPGTIAGVEPTGIRFTNGVNQATSVYTEMFNANEFVTNTTISNDVYPGSIIQGSTVADFALKGIYGHSKPITVSVSIPTSPQKVSKVIPVASSSAMRQVVRDALKNEFSGKGGFSTFNYEMKSFSYYQELKEFYGYNSKTNLLFVNNATGNGRNVDAISKRTGIMVKFLQQNFTIDMDIPEAGELIDRNTDPSIFGGVAPLYVSSVTYGRLGIMTIETQADEETATTVFRKAFSVLGIVNGSSSLTTEEKAIIDAAEIKVSVAGVSGEDAVRTITGLAGLSALITKGLTYTPESPGVPITFKMRYVNDDSNVAAPFEVNYGPFDKVYARVEYANHRNTIVDASNSIDLADIYIAFYQDPNGTVPTQAYNFLKFNCNTTTIDQYPSSTGSPDTGDIPSGSAGTTTTATSSESFRNTPKGTRLLIYKDGTLFHSIKSGDPNTPSGFDNMTFYTFSYSLSEGDGYLPLPTKTN